MWTNSVCGHPAPGEKIEDAIKRRADYELGIKNVTDISALLPNYTYTTPPYNGIIENEFCPVYLAFIDEEFVPNPAEVEAYEWLTWTDYVAKLTDSVNAEIMSYWAKDQYKQLQNLELINKLS